MAQETESGTQYTTDHDTIRAWAEARDGRPARVKDTGEADAGILRIDFPGYAGEGALQHIAWADWFDKFDKERLALAYQEETKSGERSNFNKLVDRKTVENRLSAR